MNEFKIFKMVLHSVEMDIYSEEDYLYNASMRQI